MQVLEKIADLWEHLYWADERLFEALPSTAVSGVDVFREFAHITGAQETWLSRLQQRPSRLEVWPKLKHSEMKKMMAETHAAYKRYLGEFREEDLSASNTYSNSSGKTFTTPIGDILMHVALHSQYHRGKVNLLLRQAGKEPVTIDYIAYIRALTARESK